MNQVDAQLFYLGLSIPGMGAVASQIFLIFATCAFWAMFCLFYCSPPHYTTNMADVSSIVGLCMLAICVYGRYLGVQTMVQFLFLMLWQPVSDWYFCAWKYDMLAKMQCLCSGGKNKVNMRIMTLGSFPMGMRWMTGWYFGAPCWFWNLRRSYSSYYSPKEK